MDGVVSVSARERISMNMNSCKYHLQQEVKKGAVFL